jgi:hypothetical protein
VIIDLLNTLTSTTVSIFKTSNLDIVYDMYSYSPNHQGEFDNDVDIQNRTFMDQLLCKPTYLLHSWINLHSQP